MTATGIDTVTGRMQRRTFNLISDRVLEKAQLHLEKKETMLIIEVDSGTKSIELREDESTNKQQHTSSSLLRL
jgi:hypothetical protein